MPFRQRKNMHGLNHFLIVHQHYVCCSALFLPSNSRLFFLSTVPCCCCRRHIIKHTRKKKHFICLGTVVDRWLHEEFNRTSRAKCLILIGATGTGKTTFAKSLPGQYIYFKGRWRLDSWNDHARYLIFDDIDWNKYELLGFPSKKDLLTQNGPTNVRRHPQAPFFLVEISSGYMICVLGDG